MSSLDLRAPFTKQEADELSGLYQLGRSVRGSTPPDDPRRIAGRQFAERVNERRLSVTPEYSWRELASQITAPNGKPVEPNTLKFFLGRHLYEPETDTTPEKNADLLPVSMRGDKYKGTSTNTRHRTATHFACGHPLVPENSWRSSTGLPICKTCQAARVARYKAGKRAARDQGRAPKKLRNGSENVYDQLTGQTTRVEKESA